MARGMGRFVPIFLAGVLLLWRGTPVFSQILPKDDGWDDKATRSLVERAKTLRELSALPRGTIDPDGRLPSYAASAEGHIYFFLERDDGGSPIPMRVDQVAVDVFWQAPDKTRQIIRATRKEEFLPVRDFDYYIDRLTAVQNGYGDVIRIGEGRDVDQVPHPLSTQGLALYRFRSVDSVRVTIPGLPEPLRVVEVEVAPKDENVPAFVGSLFLDDATGALARMSFTFTPASYIDRRVDRVSVTLEHSHWPDRGWLPYRQVVEVRREIPEIDLPVASVIRANLSVREYDFDRSLPPDFFAGPAITRPTQHDTTAFRQGLRDNLVEEGLTPITLAQVEREAREEVRRQLVSGLPPLRLHVANASSVLRMNRVEGVHVGGGVSYAAGAAVTAQARGGFSFGSRDAYIEGRAQWQPSTRTTLGLAGFRNQVREIGHHQGAARASNSLAALLGIADYSDPFFASGGVLSIERSGSPVTFTLRTGWERHRSPVAAWTESPVGDHVFRGTIPADGGDLWFAGLGAAGTMGDPERWSASAEFDGLVGRFTFAPIQPFTESHDPDHGTWKVVGKVSSTRLSNDLHRSVGLTISGGITGGDTGPRQHAFYLGGRGTTPGYPYRSQHGRGFFLVRVDGRLSVAPGKLSLRAFGGTGKVFREFLGSPNTASPVRPHQTAPYVGLGMGAFHDILLLELAWGLRSRSFEVFMSVNPRLWPLL